MRDYNSKCCKAYVYDNGKCACCKKYEDEKPSAEFKDGDAKTLAEINEDGHIVLKEGVMNLGTSLELVEWINEVVRKGAVKW